MQTTPNDTDLAHVWLPRRILAEGWWLCNPPEPAAGAAVLPFKRTKPLDVRSLAGDRRA